MHLLGCCAGIPTNYNPETPAPSTPPYSNSLTIAVNAIANLTAYPYVLRHRQTQFPRPNLT